MISDWLKSYKTNSEEELKSSLREIIQEISLAGLFRANFFAKAAFYGDTALRIFYKLPRFSEDMDFSLVECNNAFKLKPFLDGVLYELKSAGLNVSVKSKTKTAESNIESVWLTADFHWKDLLQGNTFPFHLSDRTVLIKIKIETDTLPPLGFGTVEHLLLKPFSCYIRCFSSHDLFASKMHALLFRKWKNRVKGRDWFDLEWYIKNGIEINLSHFYQRAVQSQDIAPDEIISLESLKTLLQKKILSVSFNKIREDVVRFVPNPKELDIWSEKYFLDLIKYIKCINE